MLYVNEEIRICRLRLQVSSRTINSGVNTLISSVIPSKYRNDTSINHHTRKDMELWIDNNGNIMTYASSNIPSVSIYNWVTFSY